MTVGCFPADLSGSANPSQVLVLPCPGHAENNQLQGRREVFQPEDQPPLLPQGERLGFLQLHVMERESIMSLRFTRDDCFPAAVQHWGVVFIRSWLLCC